MVETNDLYIEKLDVAMLRSEVSRYAEREKHVVLVERGWPPAIQMLYEASVAFNRGKIPWQGREERTHSEKQYAAILDWCKKNAPKEVSRKKWMRTVKTIVSKDYNRSIKFKSHRLPPLPAEMEIPRENLSLAVYCALSIAQWWLSRVQADHVSKFELGSWLIAAGFEKVAVIDIVSMVMGIATPHEKSDIESFYAEALSCLRARERQEWKVEETSHDHDQVHVELPPVGANVREARTELETGEAGEPYSRPVLAPRL